MSYRFASFLVSLPLISLIACGSSDDGGGGTPPGAVTITMAGTVNVTGDVMVSGNFVRAGYSFQPSCAAYAMEGVGPDEIGEEGSFRIPGPVIGVPLEPTGDVYGSAVVIRAADYAGPGTYVNNDSMDQIFGQIVLLEIPDGPEYFLEDGATTATVMADGSGTLSFEDIPENGRGTTVISGEVSWTCSEPEE